MDEYKIAESVQELNVPGIRKYKGGASLPLIVVNKIKSIKIDGKKSMFDELFEKNIIVKNVIEPTRSKDEKLETAKESGKK